jgi:hypothetical protein
MNITLCTRDFISVFVLSQQNNLRSERQHFRIRVRFRFFPILFCWILLIAQKKFNASQNFIYTQPKIFVYKNNKRILFIDLLIIKFINLFSLVQIDELNK